MDYIDKLREKVGTMPVILTSAGVIVLKDEDKVLLGYRADTKDWGLPGGYMEPGETLEETAIRELKEEIDIKAESLEIYKVFSGTEFYHEYPNGDKVYSVMAVFLYSDVEQSINVDNTEILKVKYFNLRELPERMTKTTRKILNAYRGTEM
ncbi:NUDIX hydrolase [Evansella sp. LMS18]|uniref:NUDIX hydrolase n=1 Tax=Evansella sp. LMS18 TaxID=2924033 RepID=UPI0020D17E82|nr:NUDIX hydrolase [Evansella sp. LMS18]UTR11988.1 NUDIX hydrolase [Evansella sp. LMS18]